jgi:hypothetical protein
MALALILDFCLLVSGIYIPLISHPHFSAGARFLLRAFFRSKSHPFPKVISEYETKKLITIVSIIFTSSLQKGLKIFVNIYSYKEISYKF